MNVEQLIAEACNLPLEQRAMVVDRLLQTFSASTPDVDEAWGALAQTRSDALSSGKAVGVPAELVFERIANRLHR